MQSSIRFDHRNNISHNNNNNNGIICYDQQNGRPVIINFYYQYIMSYVNMAVVTFILIGLITISRIDLRK